MSDTGEPKNPIPPHKVLRVTLNNISISLYYGNIFMVDSDIIVNPANEFLEHTGGLALKISEAAGPELLKACKKWVSSNGEIAPGKVSITPSFNLNHLYRGIIHAVGPKGEKDPKPSQSDQELLISAVYESLITANKENMSSISLPAISTGVFGYSLEYAAKNHVQAFILYAGQYRVYYPEGSLNEIKLVISKKNILDEFVKEICSKSEVFYVFDYFGLPEEVGFGALYSYCKSCERPQTLNWFEFSSVCCINICDFCIHDNNLNKCPFCRDQPNFKSKIPKDQLICRSCKTEKPRSKFCPCLKSIPY